MKKDIEKLEELYRQVVMEVKGKKGADLRAAYQTDYVQDVYREIEKLEAKMNRWQD